VSRKSAQWLLLGIDISRCPTAPVSANSVARSRDDQYNRSFYGSRMNNSPIVIAGGGIGGLSVALTLHQIGVPCVVFESVPEIKPLGVGINLQPNAVRELYELGFASDSLDAIGIQTREFVLVGLNGNEVYSEWRGLRAGYKWPQYSVHRGGLQMLLYRAAVERLGPASIRTGLKVTGYRNQPDGKGVTALLKSRNGTSSEFAGSLLIAADGLHSAVRQQMYPEQPPIQWGGAIMWRGVTRGKPIRSGASFVGLGTLILSPVLRTLTG
jgi:2-polyprenyl-6-methoxyphenol hydroxylase-like FAD-dependent oxidoreductase